MIESNIKRLMKEKRVTVRGLMSETRLANETIVRARGAHIRQCRLETLETIAHALGCRVKDLFEED